MRRSTIMIISILAMLLLAGSLAADWIHVHVTNECAVEVDIWRVVDNQHEEHWEYTGYPNVIESLYFVPTAPWVYRVEATGTRSFAGRTITHTAIGYLSITHPDSLHLYIDVSGKLPDDPPIQD